MITIVSGNPETSTMKMEEVDSSETMVIIYHNTRSHVPEDLNLKHKPLCPKIKYSSLFLQPHNMKIAQDSNSVA
jgi:hypothetical protein